MYLFSLYIVVTTAPSTLTIKGGYFFMGALTGLLIISVVFTGRQALMAFSHYHRGMAYATMDDSSKAAEELSKFINMDGGLIIPSLTVRICNKLGSIYAAQGLSEEAIRYYKKSLAENKKNLIARYNLGIVCQKEGLWKDAAEQFEFIAEQNSNYPDIYERLAEAYLSMKKWNKLTELIGKSESVNDKIVYWLEKEVYSKMVNLPEHHYALYIAYKNRMMVEKGMIELHKAAQLKSDFIDAYYDLGLAFMEEERWEEAINELKKVIAIEPELATPLHLLASCLEKTGEVYQAIEDYEKVAYLVPACQDVKLKLKELYQKLGLTDKLNEMDKQIPRVIYGNNVWEFKIPDDPQGWVPRWKFKPFEVTDGSLKAHAVGESPYMEHFGLNADIKTYNIVSIRMKLKSGSAACIFWVTSKQNESWQMSMHRYFNVIADNNYHIYNLDMSNSPLWDAILTQLRFDFVKMQAGKGDIEIDYIKLGYIF
ncbi:MAG: tetratricopeptide repeat protein [Candidatus Omnitrophota bacterium]|nr:MAG: tetratricopeptide repeat protein [Candidatus Omnitrophota bacterium]